MSAAILKNSSLFITPERLYALERRNFIAALVWKKWIEIGKATLLEGGDGSQ